MVINLLKNILQQKNDSNFRLEIESKLTQNTFHFLNNLKV